MIKNNIKLQILIGVTGVGIMFLFWKAVGFQIAANISPLLQRAFNIIALLSLNLPALSVAFLVKDNLADYGFSRRNLLRQIAIGTGIGLGMAVVLTLIPMLLFGANSIYTGERYTTAAEAIAGLAYFVFVVGLSEEFIFRGFLYEKLDNFCVSDEMPIFLSSALFGLFHLSGFNLIGILLPGLIGAFFCLCKKKIPGCTLLSLAIAHGIHDWMIRLLTSVL